MSVTNENTIKYHLTQETIKAGVWTFWRERFLRKRELILSGVFLGCLIAFGKMQHSSWFAFLVGAWVLSFWIPRFRVYRHLLRKKLKQLEQLPDGNAEVQMRDEGLVLKGGSISSELKWHQLERVIESDSVILLCWGKTDFLIIPRRSFSSELLKKICLIPPKVAPIQAR